MTRFYLTTTLAPVSAGHATNTSDVAVDRSMSSTHVPANSGVSTTVTLAQLSRQQAIFWNNAEVTHNAIDFPTTGYSFSVDVAVAGSSSYIQNYLWRITADGSALRSQFAGTTAITGTGIKTGTIAGSQINGFASRLASDRLVFSIRMLNDNSMRSEDYGIRLSDSDSWFENANLVPAAPAKQGSASGTLDFAGSSTGKETPKASTTGGYALASTATGSKSQRASSTGAYVHSGTATGAAPVVIQDGTAVGEYATAGTAAGTKITVGSATGSVAYPGAASGEAPIAAPSGLAATVISPTRVDVSWNALAGALDYQVERDGVIIAANHLTTTYSDLGLATDTTYSYRVRARI